jgi:very-short-patch-repair endonuclease
MRALRLKAAPSLEANRFEALLGFQISACGLPKPQEQVVFATGRKFAADFGWPEFKLLVEVQGGIWRKGGGAHSHPNNILRDIEKLQLAVLNGWSLFPVTTDEVKRGEAVKLIEVALKSKGWKP